MQTSRHFSHSAPAHLSEARRAIRIYGNSSLTAHCLAAEERYQRDIARVTQEMLLCEAGLRPGGIAATFAAVRETIGALLIRTGRRLERARRSDVVPGMAAAGVETAGLSR